MTEIELKQAAAQAGEDIAEIVGIELNHEIREAMSVVLEESQDQENAKPKLTVGVQLVFDLSKSPPEWKVKASVATKRTCETEPRKVGADAQLSFADLDGLDSVTMNGKTIYETHRN